MLRRTRALFALLVTLVLSCTDGGLAPERHHATLHLRPQFSGMADGEVLPIHRIRLVARDAATNAVLQTLTVTVDPNQSSWEVPLEITLTGTSIVVVVSIELINVTDGVESVQWSGQTEPLTVSAAAVTQQTVPVFYGPLENLGVTSMAIVDAPEWLFEGDGVRMRANVTTTAPTAPIIRWRSLAPAVATVNDDGDFAALTPGSARIVADAGRFADTVDISVQARPTRVTISQSVVTLTRLGEDVQLTARVEDSRGDEVEADIEWSVSSGTSIVHVGGGLFRAVTGGRATARAAVTGMSDVGAEADINVVQTPAAVVLTPGELLFDARGAAVQLTAVVSDAGGAAIDDAAITWTSSNVAAVTVNGTGLATAVADGSAIITAHAGDVTATSTARVQRTPRTLTIVAGGGQSAPAGTVLPIVPAVRVADANDHPMSGVTVQFAVSAGGGSIGSPSAVTDTDGMAGPDSWTLGPRTGANTLRATVTALAPVEFNATATAGAAARIIAFSGSGQTGVVNTTLAAPLVVHITDAFDNNVAGVVVTFAEPTSGGTLSAREVTTGADGLASVTWTLPRTAGTGTVAASSGTLGTVNFTATALAATAAGLDIVSGEGQSATVGSAITPPVVRVTDEFGNGVSGVVVTFAVTAGGGTITGATPLTSATGHANVSSWLLGTVPGVNTITATIDGTSVAISATAVAGAPAQLSVHEGDNQTATAGSAVAIAPAARVRDSFGNDLAGVAVTFYVTSGGGSITDGNAVSDANGIARVGSWTLGAGDSNTLTASVLYLEPVTFTATAQSSCADVALSPNTVVNSSFDSGCMVEGAPTRIFTLQLAEDGIFTVDLPTPFAYSYYVERDGVIIFHSALATAQPYRFAHGAAAGSFRIILQPYDGSATGSFDIGYAPGSHVMCEPVHLVRPITFAAALEESGCVYEGGTGADNYLIHLNAGAVVAATITSSAPVYLSVDGSGLASDATTQTLTFVASETGPYYFGVIGDIGITYQVAIQNAPPPTALTIHDGNNQTAPVNTMPPVAPAVRVTDAGGQPVRGLPVAFAVTAGGGSVAVPTVLTDANGIAEAIGWLLGPNPGTNTLTATVVGLTPVAFTATATDLCAAPAPLPVGTASSGAFTASGCLVDGVPTNFYTIVLDAPTVFTVEIPTALTGGFDLLLIEGTSFLRGLGTAVVPVRFSIAAPAGTYRLRVQPRDGATLGSYNIANQAGHTGACQHIAVVRPVTVSGSIAEGDCVTAGGVQDNYSPFFTPEPTTALRVSVTASAAVTVVAVHTDGTGIVAAEGTAPVLTLVPPNDMTHVAVRAASTGATYTIGFEAVLPPTTVAIHEGDGQAANAGSAVAIAPAVIVRNASNEPVQGVAVTFAVTGGGGSVTGPVALTGADGIARVGSWTLGEGTNTLSASVTGLTAATFTATGTPSTPTLTLALVDRTFVGVSFTAPLRVTLNQPAPTGGLTVAVTSGDGNLLTVAAPGSVTIPAGATSADITLNGISAGSATITATAEDVNTGTLAVTVSLRLISLPTTLNVPFAGTASLPVQLAEPAPAGGTVVTLVSTDPSRVGVSTATVTVAAGALTANATLSGVYPGTATITATAVEYIGSSTAAATRANLNVVESSTAFSVGFPVSVTVRFESSGSAIAAPSGGVPVTVTSRSGTCATAADVTIPAGLTSQTISLNYGGSAATPCTTYVVVSAPDIAPDSVQVTVNPPPAISMSTSTTVGAGLQRSRPSAFLGISTHGGAIVQLVSADPTKLLLAPNQSTAGVDTLYVTVPNGTTNIPFYVQAQDTVTGVVAVTASTNNFTSASMNVTIVQPAIEMHNLPATTTTLSGRSHPYAQVGIPCSSMTSLCEVQNRRAGAPAIPVTFAMPDTTTVGRLVVLADSGTSVVAYVQPVIYYTPTSVAGGGAGFQPLSDGTAQITASAAGFTSLPIATRSITVSSPSISVGATTVASGLMRSRGSASLGASQHGGVVVRVTSNDTTLALVSPNTGTPGTPFIDVTVANGATNIAFYVHGLEGVTGATSVTVSAPGFSTGGAAITVVQPGIELHNVASSTTSLSPSTVAYAQVGIRNSSNSALNEVQNVRAGAPPLVVSFVTPDSNVVRLVTARGASDTATAVINPGLHYTPTSTSAGVAVDPNRDGTTTVSVSAPGFVSLTNATRSITVSTPTISLSNTHVGAGLQRSRAGASLSASQHGGVTVTVVSVDSSRILLSPNSTTPGTGTIEVTVANGATNIPFYVQGVENTTGTSTITISAPGFSTNTATYTVSQPAILLTGIPGSTTTLSPQSQFYAYVGIANSSQNITEVQDIRAGGSPIAVTVTSSTTAGQLVTTSTAGGSATVTIPVGLYYSPTTVASGGVAFRPLTGGTTRVTASAPNILNGLAYRDVTVTAPAINMGATTIGSGLMRSRGSASLGASNHGGVTVRIRSSNPGVVLLSPNTSTAGMDSIDIVVANGATNIPFIVHGVDGATGTVTLTASAPGFTDGTTTVTNVTAGFEMHGLSSSLNLASNDDPGYVQVGIPCSSGTSLCEVQNRRAGQPALAVTITTSSAAVAPLVTSAGTGATAAVQIAAGIYYSPTTVSGGGFAVRALGIGDVTITASIPGMQPMTTATRSVTIVNASVNTTAATVGAGLQRVRPSSSLSGPNHGGVTVRITSTDPSRLLVSPNASTAGASFIDITVPHGSSSFSYYTHGVENTTGSVAVTAEITGWTSSTATWSIVQPAVEIHGLPTSTTAGGATDAFYAQVGLPNSGLTGLSEVQNVRAGASAVTVTFTSSNGAVAQVLSSSGTAATGTATVPVGLYHTPTSIAGGGVGFDPIAAGTVTITATAPGFRAVTISSRTVTVQ